MGKVYLLSRKHNQKENNLENKCNIGQNNYTLLGKNNKQLKNIDKVLLLVNK